MYELKYKVTKDRVEDVVRGVLESEPLDIVSFLSKLDLLHLPCLLLKEYEKDFKFDPVSMAKAAILKKIKGMKSFEELHRFLKDNPDKAKLLVVFHHRLKFTSHPTFLSSPYP